MTSCCTGAPRGAPVGVLCADNQQDTLFLPGACLFGGLVLTLREHAPCHLPYRRELRLPQLVGGEDGPGRGAGHPAYPFGRVGGSE